MFRLAALFVLGLTLSFGWQEPDAAPPNPEQSPNGRWSRRLAASSD